MSEHARRKQSPIPDEPRPKKKAVKRRIRSDHKHEYEWVAVDALTYFVDKDGKHPYYNKVERCTKCGKINNSKRLGETVPEGMRIFRVEGWRDLFAKTLPDDKEVTEPWQAP